MSDLYNNIKKICDDRKIAITQLEKKSGLGNGTIGKWRDVTPNMASLEAVAKALGLPTAELMKA